MTDITLNPIGVIHTPFHTRFGTPRQPGIVPAATGEIRLHPAPHLNGCLEGLQDFSHLWVLFWFHQNTNQAVRGKVHPPRKNGESVGLFATRSPHRPNPIGLSVVEVVRVLQWSIEVRGPDLVDGTPILDIKPYLPEIEAVPEARGSWTTAADGGELQVRWQDEALETLKASDPYWKPYLEMVEQVLRQDPRPHVYKSDSEGRYRQDHIVWIGGWDVTFAVHGQVVNVLKLHRRNE